MSDLVSQSIKNMQNGVSQQSAALRYSSQCAEQFNCRNDPVDGMGKRYNTTQVAALAGITDPSSYRIDTFERDTFEQYKMFVRNGEVKVVDASTGFEYTVEATADVLQYLALRGDVPGHRAFQLLNTIDTTFVLNKTVPVKYLPAEQDTSPPPVTNERVAEVSISRHPYPTDDVSGFSLIRSSHYEFIVNGTTYTYNDATAPTATVADWLATQIATEYPTALSVKAVNGTVEVKLASNDTISVTGTWEYSRQTYIGEGEWNEAVLTSGSCTTLTHRDSVIPLPTPLNHNAIWYIKQADYATSYEVTLGGHVCSITTPEATSAQARAGLDTTGLTEDMKDAINAKSASHNCSAVRYGNVVFITRADGSDFTITHSDDLGDRASYAIKEYVESFDTLPPTAPEGFRVEVRGEVSDTEVEPYHLIYTSVSETGDETAGYWKETVKYGIATELDPRTMPHFLKRKQASGYVAAGNPLGIYFEVEQAPWAGRTVGDDFTAPFPSFCSEQDAAGAITQTRSIKAMTYHHNRMCFISDENLIFSETGEYLNFFPTTVVTTLDADPIDVALSLNEIAPVEHAVQHAGELFLFSAKTQMIVTSGDVFNADSLNVDVLSDYRMDTTAAPFVHEGTIHFWAKGTKYSTLYEYLPQGDSGRYIALPVTAHVPTYVQGQVLRTLSVQSEGMLLHLTRGEDGSAVNHVYVTNIMMQGAERAQNAWQKWTFAGKVIDLAIVKNKVSLIVEYSDGVFLEEIILSHDPLKEELGFPVFLDRREEVNVNFTLPVGDTRVIYENKGRYWTGFRYEQKYTFSEFFARNGENKAITGGRLQLRYLELAFHDTTNFVVTTTRGGQPFRIKTYEGLVIGSLQYLLGEVPTLTGVERFPIHTKASNAAITVTNDTEHDAVFHAAEWEGTYTRRTRRM